MHLFLSLRFSSMHQFEKVIFKLKSTKEFNIIADYFDYFLHSFIRTKIQIALKQNLRRFFENYDIFIK